MDNHKLVWKKKPFTENYKTPAPSNGGERKKNWEADVSRKSTDSGGKKNNGKFTNGKSKKKYYGKDFMEKKSQRPPLVQM